MAKRLGTLNDMAPEQWEPKVKGPMPFQTNSWGLGCSIVKMLTGYQPWYGCPIGIIYQSVVEKQEKTQYSKWTSFFSVKVNIYRWVQYVNLFESGNLIHHSRFQKHDVSFEILGDVERCNHYFVCKKYKEYGC
ncbi:E3 ubiquitin-protein ligase KEG [Spatholobus suberectus]|nr:E3 ubiquitin-protein ligase KEG [Spatholobus suberectus]